MLNIGVTGAAGRMGRALITVCTQHPNSRLAAAIERPGSSLLASDAGDLAGLGRLDISLVDTLEDVIGSIDTLIDFTRPDATLSNLSMCVNYGKNIVIGTTGFDAAQKQQIREAAERIGIVFAPNMSVGVNLCLKLLDTAARVLGDDVDIEIIEAHHRHKVDAPSGTALMLGEAAAEGRGVSLPDVADRGRDGITGARNAGAIGFTAIRGGDIVGEHEVIFAGEGERIKISHIATDRRLFAKGAIKAAIWGRGKGPGCFDMRDVLGLK